MHGIFIMQTHGCSIQRCSFLLNCQRSRLGRVRGNKGVSCSKHFRQIFLARLDKLNSISEAITLGSEERYTINTSKNLFLTDDSSSAY